MAPVDGSSKHSAIGLSRQSNRTVKILMCRPDYFGIEYEINPWMHVEVQADRALAEQQWQTLYDTYREFNVEIELAEPHQGLPDMVFSANAGLIWKEKVVLSHFQHPERQGEEQYWREKFQQLGMEIHEIRDISFEGAGDGLFAGDRLFLGYGFRTDPAAHQKVGEILGVETVSLQLVDARFYHLDTCFCPLNADTVLFAPEAFSPESADRIRAEIKNAIAVPGATAQGFACNAIAVDGTVISSLTLKDLEAPMAEAGYRIRPLPMSEFMKSGGGVRCLSLPLDMGPGS